MNELVTAAKEIQDFFNSKNWPFVFIGGFAVIRWGEPRFTRDVDLTLYTGFENEEQIINDILQQFKARRPDMQTFALKNRVVLVETSNQIPADIALGGLLFEQMMIERGSEFEYEQGVKIRTCSAEDLIIQKAFAARVHDWSDIEGILIRQSGNLDWKYIHENLEPLCELKEEPGIMKKLASVREYVREL